MAEMPTLNSANYANTIVDMGWATDNTVPTTPFPDFNNRVLSQTPAQFETIVVNNAKEERQMSKRIVEVYVVDPHEDVKPEDSLIWKDQDRSVTDLSDEEIWFEFAAEIAEALREHNEKRTRIPVKDWEGREPKYLEPARIRDVTMTVVTVAEF